MSNYKFDQFYYSSDDKIHLLEDIVDVSDDEYVAKYADKMYCPSCHAPQLSRVRRNNRIHLRAYPNQHHIEVDGEMCMYSHDTAPQRVVTNHIQNLHYTQQLYASLDAVICMMLRQQRHHDQQDGGHLHVEANPLVIHRQRQGVRVAEVLPHYSLLNWGVNIPQDQLLIAYARRVYIYVHIHEAHNDAEDNAESVIVYLRFYKDESMQNLLSSMRKPDNIDIESGYYQFAAAGYCIQNGLYYNFKPFNRLDSIVINRVEQTL